MTDTSAVPHYYVLGRIRRALADEAELGVEIAVLPHRIRIAGVVATAARRERLEAVIRALCPGCAIVNEISLPVFEPRPPEAIE